MCESVATKKISAGEISMQNSKKRGETIGALKKEWQRRSRKETLRVYQDARNYASG